LENGVAETPFGIFELGLDKKNNRYTIYIEGGRLISPTKDLNYSASRTPMINYLINRILR